MNSAVLAILLRSSLVLHTGSVHFSGGNHNNLNAGAGIAYAVTDSVSVQGGFFRNSVFNWSEYISGEYRPIHFGGFSAGAFGGAVNHYRLNNGRAIPVAGLVAQYKNFRVRYVPGFKDSGNVATLELVFPL
jgi:hypothetical protein